MLEPLHKEGLKGIGSAVAAALSFLLASTHDDPFWIVFSLVGYVAWATNMVYYLGRFIFLYRHGRND